MAYCIPKRVWEKEKHHFEGVIILTNWQQATPNPATGTHEANDIILPYIILGSQSTLMENTGIFK